MGTRMKKDKNVSSLSDHVLEKKKGILASPWNHSMREANINFHSTSWSRERLPEYLWLGLILLKYGRKEAFNKLGYILKYLSEIDNTITFPRISSILSLPDEKQAKFYERILEHVEKAILSPLTIIICTNNYPIFNKYFYTNTSSIKKNISILREANRKLWDHQSNESTDIRFLALSLMLFNSKIYIGPQTKDTAIAITSYPTLEHDDERMRIYRPIIRSMEGISFEEEDYSFSRYFWSEIGMLDECNTFYMKFEKTTLSKNDIIKDTKEALDYVCAFYKNELIYSEKFSVLSGSLCYALKLFEEIISKKLGNSILGRHGLRSILEMLIICKYLIKNEIDHPNIWEEYKQYGIGKYKLILLKSREKEGRKDSSHFDERIIDVLVNEKIIEEYQDVDLKYFDKTGMREKSIEVDEKELYDIIYDYDSNYVHGLWGAIRESSVMACSNPNHHFHSVPDIFNVQEQSSVIYDTEMILIELLKIFNSQYSFPQWFGDKYFEVKDHE